MTYAELSEALFTHPLFAGKSWKLSPQEWSFSEEQSRELIHIGDACLAFYEALEKLYLAAYNKKKILRNGNLCVPWVAEILNRGKPLRLLEHQASRRLTGTLPPILRPDLLLTKDGFALTELDSVPGGIGLTAFLSKLYALPNSIPELFWDAISTGARSAVIAILISDEATDYRPEYEWLAQDLRSLGANIFIAHPAEITVSPTGVFLNDKKIDIIYRFFELFDLGNVPAAASLFDAVEQGAVKVFPPMRPFQEEKMSLALLHHPELQAYWEESLKPERFLLLKKLVPETWILEPLTGTLPASAVLWGPHCNGRPIRQWEALAQASRKDRNLVLKASGFSELAWGARSVTIGNDSSQTEWATALNSALRSAEEKNLLYVIQRFHKPARFSHPQFNPLGESVPAEFRVRICPYYFVSREDERSRVQLGGALCTLCPPDKKIIHGMSDAILLPGKIKIPLAR